jgi:hypothetical protein
MHRVLPNRVCSRTGCALDTVGFRTRRVPRASTRALRSALEPIRDAMNREGREKQVMNGEVARSRPIPRGRQRGPRYLPLFSGGLYQDSHETCRNRSAARPHGHPGRRTVGNNDRNVSSVRHTHQAAHLLVQRQFDTADPSPGTSAALPVPGYPIRGLLRRRKRPPAGRSSRRDRRLDSRGPLASPAMETATSVSLAKH